jgi:hypothetical protein
VHTKNTLLVSEDVKYPRNSENLSCDCETREGTSKQDDVVHCKRKTSIMYTRNLINLLLVRPSKEDVMGESSSTVRRNAYVIRVAKY